MCKSGNKIFKALQADRSGAKRYHQLCHIPPELPLNFPLGRRAINGTRIFHGVIRRAAGIWATRYDFSMRPVIVSPQGENLGSSESVSAPRRQFPPVDASPARPAVQIAPG